MSAEEYLTEKFKDHPLTIKWPEQLPKIMESYAREYHAKEMERKLGMITKALKTKPNSNTGLMYDRGWEDALDVVGNEILNHLKQQIKSKR